MTAAALSHTQERKANTFNGGVMLLWLLLSLLLMIWLLVDLIGTNNGLSGLAVTILAIVFIGILVGFYTLQPNEAAAITLFGNYKGTDRTPGLRWVLPWYKRTKISVRVRNVTGERLKVNDKRGNPIEIAAVIVWRVTNTAQAIFDVDEFVHYVTVQSESALRHLASAYPYDTTEEGQKSLRGSMDEVSESLTKELQDRVMLAGVKIDEARLSHLAYAPEIAHAMLQRQQAEAIVAARTRIVDGAVGMVEMALERLDKRSTVKLDDERRAAMVSNLLVVLCGDRSAQPVVNTGTIYS